MANGKLPHSAGRQIGFFLDKNGSLTRAHLDVYFEVCSQIRAIRKSQQNVCQRGFERVLKRLFQRKSNLVATKYLCNHAGLQGEASPWSLELIYLQKPRGQDLHCAGSQ